MYKVCLNERQKDRMTHKTLHHDVVILYHDQQDCVVYHNNITDLQQRHIGNIVCPLCNSIGEKNVLSNQVSNHRPLAYSANALPTALARATATSTATFLPSYTETVLNLCPMSVVDCSNYDEHPILYCLLGLMGGLSWKSTQMGQSWGKFYATPLGPRWI